MRKKKVVGSGSSDDEALQGNARLYTETCSVFMHCVHALFMHYFDTSTGSAMSRFTGCCTDSPKKRVRRHHPAK